MWSFVAGFCGAVVGVVVTAYTGSPQLGMAMGGMVAGAILGAVNGGLEGALKGAAMGFLMGAALGTGYGAFNAVGLGGAFLATAAVGGAVYAGVTGGAEGLGDYAAGAVGSMAGFYAGNAITNGTTNLNSQGLPKTNETQIPSEVQPAIDETIKNNDWTGAKDIGAASTGEGTPRILSDIEIDNKIATSSTQPQSKTGGAGNVLGQPSGDGAAKISFSVDMKYGKLTMTKSFGAWFNGDGGMSFGVKYNFNLAIKTPFRNFTVLDYNTRWFPMGGIRYPWSYTATITAR